MKIAKNKLRMPKWDNALTDWRDHPYDKGRVKKNRALLHSIFNYLKENDLVDKDFCTAGNLLVDELAEQASYFMDIAFELSRKTELAHVPNEMFEIVAAINDEMNLIYEHIKKDIGFSEEEGDLFEERKKSALEFFDCEQKLFKFIKAEHLKDKSLFFRSEGRQSKRNFWQRLLPKVLKDRGLGEWPAGLLQIVAEIGNDMRKMKKV